MTDTESRPGVGAVQIGVLLLALATAGVHLYLFLIEGFLGNGEMLPIYQFLFVANFLAYVTLASALVLPISALVRVRSLVRTLLIAIAVASIASYFYVGVLDVVGNITKAIEVLIVLLVTVNAATSEAGEEVVGRYSSGALGAAIQLALGLVVGSGMFLILTPFMV